MWARGARDASTRIMKLQVSASVELDAVSSRIQFAAFASLVVAIFVALASLGGILSPAIYARETAVWRTQGIGQDWANLLVAVPWLVISAFFTLRGSGRARILLAGGLAYTTYAYVLYAFAVHFNALFLVYCGALGLSVYGLIALASELRGARRWFDRSVPRRLVGGFEMVCAAAFALLWMFQILPALLAGTDPAGLAETGLFTNPVHVLDLALVLPATFAAGWLLWHRRLLGYILAPIVLAFVILMGASLGAMAIAQYAAGLVDNLAVAIGAAVLTVVSAALLVSMLRQTSALPAATCVGRLTHDAGR